jgi:hypothetical protein
MKEIILDRGKILKNIWGEAYIIDAGRLLKPMLIWYSKRQASDDIDDSLVGGYFEFVLRPISKSTYYKKRGEEK